ncbi:MAG: hypothetical protein ACT6FG_08465 [Methanosarcinaceae archaeon]
MFENLNYTERFGLVAWLTLLPGIGLMMYGAVNSPPPMTIYMFLGLVLTWFGLCLVASYYFMMGASGGMNNE